MRKSEYPKEAKTTGQKIRKKRMDLGRTLLDVAKEVEITEGYLSRIETDKQAPTPKVGLRILKALNEELSDYPSWMIFGLLIKKEKSKKTNIPYIVNKNEFTRIAQKIESIVRSLPPSAQRSQLEELNKELWDLGNNHFLKNISAADIIKGLTK